MISGEMGFDEHMYNENTKAYYKVAFLIYILFALIMTVFVTNLLIGKMQTKERERERKSLSYRRVLPD
jgi:hypothetical protein